MTLSLSSAMAIKFSQPAACLLFIMASVIVSQLALTGFHKWAAKYKLAFHNEVAGIVFGGISLIHSLVLAFVIVAVWDDYTDLEKTIETETDKLNNIIVHADLLPDDIKANISNAIFYYCNEVTGSEWQVCDKSRLIAKPNTMRSLRKQLLITSTDNRIQKNVLSVIDADLNTLGDLRRERLHHSHSQVPDMVWFILDAGSIMLIVFFFFLSVPSLRLKRIYLGFLVSCMAMCMFLVHTLDHPFNSKNSTGYQLFKDVKMQLKTSTIHQRDEMF